MRPILRLLKHRVGPEPRSLVAMLAMGLALLAPSFAVAQTDPLAPTGRWSANTRGSAPVPPMGWNSWNAFKSDIDEEKIMASATILVESGLAQRGYRYVNIDDGWWSRRRQSDGRMVNSAPLVSAAAGARPSALRLCRPDLIDATCAVQHSV